MWYPEEISNIKKIQHNFKLTIENGKRLFKLGVDTLAQPVHIEKIPGIDKFALIVTAGILTKICRLYRGIYILGSSGLVAEAEILQRSLYESMIGLFFILRPRVILRQNDKPLRRIGKKSFNSIFRARLYFAFERVQLSKKINIYEQTAGLKGLSKRMNKIEIDKQMQTVERVVGKEWLNRLKRSKTYSGVSLKDLAQSLGLISAHQTAYYYMSKTAHAMDSSDYIHLDAQQGGLYIRLHDDLNSLGRIFGTADVLFFHSIDIYNRRFKLGLDRKLENMKAKLDFKERIRNV